MAERLDLVWQPAGKAAAIRDPWVVVFYCVAALFAGVVVSLLTKPADDKRLTRFYDLTRTPIAADETQGEPCELPPGVLPAKRTMICTAMGLEIPLPSKTSVVGFAAGWLAVAALIGGFVWLVGG